MVPTEYFSSQTVLRELIYMFSQALASQIVKPGVHPMTSAVDLRLVGKTVISRDSPAGIILILTVTLRHM